MLQFEVILINLLYIELGVTKKENIPKSKRSPFNFNKRRKYGREDRSSPPEKQQAEHTEHNMGSLYEFILQNVVEYFFLITEKFYHEERIQNKYRPFK